MTLKELLVEYRMFSIEIIFVNCLNGKTECIRTSKALMPKGYSYNLLDKPIKGFDCYACHLCVFMDEQYSSGCDDKEMIDNKEFDLELAELFGIPREKYEDVSDFCRRKAKEKT